MLHHYNCFGQNDRCWWLGPSWCMVICSHHNDAGRLAHNVRVTHDLCVHWYSLKWRLGDETRMHVVIREKSASNAENVPIRWRHHEEHIITEVLLFKYHMYKWRGLITPCSSCVRYIHQLYTLIACCVRKFYFTESPNDCRNSGISFPYVTSTTRLISHFAHLPRLIFFVWILAYTFSRKQRPLWNV